jgi:hypothetical protein
MLTHGTKALINTARPPTSSTTPVLQMSNGEGGRGDQPASPSCGDVVNLVDQPDLPDNIALG